MRSGRVHRMGQNFLVNAHIAEVEAEHAEGKSVLEIGPGPGMLTRALLRKARRVVAVEMDTKLYTAMKANVRSRKLKLINKDFMDVTDEEVGLGSLDIVISNIPYSLSSKVIEWLAERKVQAVLCLQREFVQHMLAPEDTDDYSRLSVLTALSFRVTKIMDVSRGNFRPVPLVDSAIIYMKPLESALSRKERMVISALMQHKKKTVRNAMIDSCSMFDARKREIASRMEDVDGKEDRVFKIPPRRMLELSREIISKCGI